MTQTSGKTGLGGAGRKRGSRGPVGSGGWLIPLLRSGGSEPGGTQRSPSLSSSGMAGQVEPGGRGGE